MPPRWLAPANLSLTLQIVEPAHRPIPSQIEPALGIIDLRELAVDLRRGGSGTYWLTQRRAISATG
jgi:hypothetical protein